MDGTLATYRAVDTHGKSQLELILQVYDGALSAYREAARCYEKQDLSAGYESLEKAKRFVVHLYTTLDPEKGGEIAEQLGKLYAYVVNQTNVVEATKDLSLIDDIISVLENLRLGWAGLKEQETSSDQKPPEVTAAPRREFSTSA
jgi:flagellar protein FliS